MIPLPSGVQVWLATGHTDMRKGFDGLALLVQETLKRNPHNGHLFVFRGRRGALIKVLWHDGQGMCLFAKRLERGRFIWPSTTPRDGADRTATLADWVGACAATLMPLVLSIRAHIFTAERIHADETTVPVQAKGKCRTGRLWTYVRDDQPFGGADPPAAAFFYSPDRGGKHPEAHLASYAG